MSISGTWTDNSETTLASLAHLYAYSGVERNLPKGSHVLPLALERGTRSAHCVMSCLFNGQC